MRVPSCLLLSLVLVQTGPARAEGASDPKATAVADRVMEALGGADAWNATRYLRFDFAVDRGGKNLVRRAHTWDKWTGNYRLEPTTREGEPSVVLLNTNTKDGTPGARGRSSRARRRRSSSSRATGSGSTTPTGFSCPSR